MRRLLDLGSTVLATDTPHRLVTSSTDVANGVDPLLFDAARPWRLHVRVSLRPEPFGAMAYHYDNRRLNFLRSHELVALVESLDQHPSARAAFEALEVDPRRWPAFERALASLAVSDFLELRTADSAALPSPSPEKV